MAELRVGGVDLVVPSGWSWSGDASVSAEGMVDAASTVEVEYAREALLAFVESGEWVPVLSDTRPEVNGFYHITGADLSDVGVTSRGRAYGWRLDLERFPSAAVFGESTLGGALRANDHAISSEAVMLTPPGQLADTQIVSSVAVQAAPGVVATETGDVTRVAFSQALPTLLHRAVWPATAATWYNGAPRLLSGGVLVSSSASTVDVADWSFDNGLIRVRPGATTNVTFRIDYWDGSAWSGTTNVFLGFHNTGTATDRRLTHTTINVVRHLGGSVADQSIRVGFGGSHTAGSFLTLRMRRGERWCFIGTDKPVGDTTHRWYAQVADTATDLTGAIMADTGTRRLFLAMSDAYDDTLTNPARIQQASGTQRCDIGIGLAAAADASDMLPQYYGDRSETVSVVAP